MSLKNKDIILLIALFSLIINKKSNSMVIFPFKTISVPYLIDYRKDKNNYNTSIEIKNHQIYNSSRFFDDHYIFRILSTIKIGQPSQDIICFINIYYDKLLIGEITEISENTFSKSFQGYNYEKSSSFKNLTSEKGLNNDESKEFIGQESIYLYTNFNDIKNNKYTFYPNFKFKYENKIKLKKNSFYGPIIGLILSDNIYEINFMRQIYDRNIISQYIVSFEYKNYNEGMLIIGKLPHEYMPDKYKEEQYKSFYSYQPRTMYLSNFAIDFEEIYSKINDEKIFLSKKHKVNIILNSGLIIGTKQYLEFLEQNFFNKYINKNICEKYITNSDLDNYIIFACAENENLNLEEFPTLNFKMKSENLIFEFDYKDLFKKKENRYYFMVAFEKYSSYVWRLGKPFFIKNTFVYNGDAKTIGFYQKKMKIK